jgi:hypothetical protein
VALEPAQICQKPPRKNRRKQTQTTNSSKNVSTTHAAGLGSGLTSEENTREVPGKLSLKTNALKTTRATTYKRQERDSATTTNLETETSPTIKLMTNSKKM